MTLVFVLTRQTRLDPSLTKQKGGRSVRIDHFIHNLMFLLCIDVVCSYQYVCKLMENLLNILLVSLQ